MIQNKVVSVIAAALLVTTVAANADNVITSTATNNLNQYNRPGAFGLTLEAGQLIFDSSRNLKDKTIPEAGLTYDINNHFAVQAMFSLLNTNQINSGLSVHGAYYTLNGLLFLDNKHPFQPYITAGVGALNLDPNGVVTPQNPGGNEPNLNANLNFGAGFQLFLNRNVAFQVEGKTLYTPAQSDNDFLVNGGLTFLFGAHPKALTVTNSSESYCQLQQNVTVDFIAGSTHISNASREKLNNIAACLSANPTYKLYLTSLIVAVQPNVDQALISKRTNVVEKYFKSAGINSKRIFTQQVAGTSGAGRTVVMIKG